MTATVIEQWASLPRVAFSARPHFYEGEDFITYFINDNRCFARRVNELVTVYTDCNTGDLVGCKVKGVRRILSNIKSFNVKISDGNTTLGLLFLSLLADSSDCEKPTLRDAASKFSSVPLPPAVFLATAA